MWYISCIEVVVMWYISCNDVVLVCYISCIDMACGIIVLYLLYWRSIGVVYQLYWRGIDVLYQLYWRGVLFAGEFGPSVPSSVLPNGGCWPINGAGKASFFTHFSLQETTLNDILYKVDMYIVDLASLGRKNGMEQEDRSWAVGVGPSTGGAQGYPAHTANSAKAGRHNVIMALYYVIKTQSVQFIIVPGHRPGWRWEPGLSPWWMHIEDLWRTVKQTKI